jgi:tight adherence protein C
VLPSLLPFALAASVLLAGVAIRMLVIQPIEGRFEDADLHRRLDDEQRPSVITAFLDRLGAPAAPAILSILGRERVAAWQQLIAAAGRPAGITVESLAARSFGYSLVFGLAALPMTLDGMWWLSPTVTVVGATLPYLALRSQADERQQAIGRALPDFLDVLAVTVTAGLDFRSSLERVCDAFEGPLVEEVRTALQQMQLGVSRREALDDLSRRNPADALGEFVTALQQAEDLGAPLTGALAAIADDVRRSYAQEARRKAAKVEPRLSVMLTVTLIPGALITIAVGFWLTSGADLGGLLSG